MTPTHPESRFLSVGQHCRLVSVSLLLPLLLLCSPLSARTVETLEPAPPVGDPAAMVPLDLIEQAETLADDFNLTPAQRALIGLLLTSAATDAVEIASNLVDGRRAMNDLLWTEPTDATAVASQAAVQGQRMADLSALVVDTLVAVRRALTEDQRLMLVELAEQLETALVELRDRLGTRDGRRIMDRLEMRRADLDATLGLTAEQRAAIQQIVDGATPEVLAIAAEVAANRNALADAVRSAPDDEATIDALLDAQAGLFESLALIRADAVLQVRDVLTEEQRARIERLRQAIADWFDARLGNLGDRIAGGFGGF